MPIKAFAKIATPRPGFLLIALQVFHEEPSFVDAVAFYLTPNRSNELSQREIEQFRCFTVKQCAVIRRWLEYFQKKQSDYPIYVDNALKRYWQSAG